MTNQSEGRAATRRETLEADAVAAAAEAVRLGRLAVAAADLTDAIVGRLSATPAIRCAATHAYCETQRARKALEELASTLASSPDE